MIDTDDDEIGLIRDSAASVAPPGGDLRRIRALRFTRPGFDGTIWHTMREMGWLGLLVPEPLGGSGLGMRAFCALIEQLGAGLTPEPLIEAAMAAMLHPPLLADSAMVLPAWQERANTLDAGMGTVLRDGRVTGKKLFIPMAAGAAAFLVITRDGATTLVAADAPGVSVTIVDTQDGGNLGTLTLQDAPGETVHADAGAALATAALDIGALATAASLLGVMERAFALTLDYLKTRQQFGKPIGSFQALQHRMVDLRIQIALTRASVTAAARTFDAGEPGTGIGAGTGHNARHAAVSRAKARASQAGLLVAREAVQLHGAIGYTDEYDVGLYLRRAMVLANRYGGAGLHRARYAASEPETDDG